jgi:hypothetical protein
MDLITAAARDRARLERLRMMAGALEDLERRQPR